MNHSIRHLATASGIALVLLLQGCGTTHRFAGPPLPFQVELSTLDPRIASVHGAISAEPDEERRRTLRNQYIAEKLLVVDIQFLSYVREISSDKRNLDAAAEGAQMTLAVAATLVSGVQAKENLAAAIALVTGGKAVVDKNFFADKAIDAFVATMVAVRKERMLAILKGYGQSTEAYPLNSALQDLAAYIMAGSPLQAAAAIQNDALLRAASATRDIKDFQDSIAPDRARLQPADSNVKRRLRTSLVKENLTPLMLTTTLTALGIDPTNRTEEQKFRALVEQVHNAGTAERIKDLDAAFRKGGILK